MKASVSREYLSALDDKAAAAEKSLREYFKKRTFQAPQTIIEAMEYSLFSPGKKIRPVLVREISRLVSGEEESVTALADSIEMIHTYSLIHDDLPAMDDATLRRGQPANHIAFNEAVAVLAGDGLLNLAMERALEDVPETDPQYYINAVRVLFEASGVDGMVGGQTADIGSCDDLDYIESHKTGALLKAAILCGALPHMERDDWRVAVLGEYADSIGKAFQIVDDILDVTADSSETGKDQSADIRNETLTYVSLYGLEEAKNRAEELRRDAHRSLDKLGISENEFIRFLTDFLCGIRSIT